MDSLHCVRIIARKWRWRKQELAGPGHVPRAACRGVGDTDHWAAGAGLELGWAARGQFVTNNTKYRQVHPWSTHSHQLLIPSWGNVFECLCAGRFLVLCGAPSVPQPIFTITEKASTGALSWLKALLTGIDPTLSRHEIGSLMQLS